MAKKYSIVVEDDQIVAVEVDGVRYSGVDDIPDEQDRSKMFLLVESWPGADLGPPAPAKPSRWPGLIVPLFLAIALLMLAIAAYSGINTGRTLARETTATGRVVELVQRADSSGQPFFYPVVEFDLAGGGRQRVQVMAGSWPAAYRLGDPVTVAFNPAQPSGAWIKSRSSTLGRYALTIITGILGLAFIGGTLLARWVMKPTAEEP